MKKGDINVKKEATDFLKRNSKILKGNKPNAIVMKLDGWYECCPACFMMYKNDGKCSWCGLEILVKKDNNYNVK